MNKYQCTKCKEYKAIAPLTSCDDCNEKQVELEQQARIGRATLKAFEQRYSLMRDDGDFEETFDNDIVYEYDLKTIATNEQELLEWAKEENE